MIRIMLILWVLIIPTDLFSIIYYSPNLLQMAKGGDAYSQYALGECYAWGLGIEKNPKEALLWWEKAADNGNLNARLNLGKFYEFGYLLKEVGRRDDGVKVVSTFSCPGVEKDFDKAISNYEGAAISDDYEWAQYHLSEIFYEGTITNKNYDKAFEYLNTVVSNPKLKKEQRGVAMNRLANCYRYGRGTVMDIDKSNYWREQAVINGYQDAQDISGVGVYGQLYNEDGSIYTPNESIQFVTFMKKEEYSKQNRHCDLIMLKQSEKGRFTIPAEYTGETLVMEVIGYQPIEFVATQNLKLTLIKE